MINALIKDGWRMTHDPLVLKWRQKDLYIDLGAEALVAAEKSDRRIHSCLIHVKIRDGKIWIERDGTEHGIANAFVAAGIPREFIVLGFYSPSARHHTDFAIA